MGLARRKKRGLPTLSIVADAPGPVLALHAYYVIDGIPIHFVGERWRKEDARHCPYPTTPDPLNPDHVLTWRLFDGMTGEIIPDVSSEAFRVVVADASPPVSRASGRGHRRLAIHLRRG